MTWNLHFGGKGLTWGKTSLVSRVRRPWDNPNKGCSVGGGCTCLVCVLITLNKKKGCQIHPNSFSVSTTQFWGYVVFPVLDALREWLSSGIVGGLDTSIILDKQKVLSTSSLDILGESIDIGWWFGTCFMTFHLLGRIFPTDELIFFRGVGQPPTRQS